MVDAWLLCTSVTNHAIDTWSTMRSTRDQPCGRPRHVIERYKDLSLLCATYMASSAFDEFFLFPAGADILKHSILRTYILVYVCLSTVFELWRQIWTITSASNYDVSFELWRQLWTMTSASSYMTSASNYINDEYCGSRHFTLPC